MKNTNTKRGFTLIELLVVIVILGILSTISVGTFRSYFSKARDSERVSTIQNVAMMVKVDSGGTGDCTVYNYGNHDDAGGGACTAPIDFTGLFSANDFSMATPKNDARYFYGFLPTADNNNDFFVVVAAEEEGAQNGREVISSGTDVAGSVFADGTVGGISAITADGAWGTVVDVLTFTCPTSGAWVCGQICADGTLDTELDGCDDGTANTPF